MSPDGEQGLEDLADESFGLYTKSNGVLYGV